jgi:hypothetical protein
MKIIDERQYSVEGDETVSVSVEAKGTAHLVEYDLDKAGAKGLSEGQVLTFGAPTQPRRVLTLLFTFSGNTGGQSYTVTLKGDKGGSDTDVIDQGSFGIPATSADYHFRLQ